MADPAAHEVQNLPLPDLHALQHSHLRGLALTTGTKTATRRSSPGAAIGVDSGDEERC